MTARNLEVPVYLEIGDNNVPIDLESWDHIVQCSIIIESGELAIFGVSDYQPDAFKIPVEPGIYEVTVLYQGLDTLSEDGLEGDDLYKILLSPTDKLEDIKILKQAID